MQKVECTREGERAATHDELFEADDLYLGGQACLRGAAGSEEKRDGRTWSFSSSWMWQYSLRVSYSRRPRALRATSAASRR